MALGEQMLVDKAGPQFTYEVQWEADMSISLIRPTEVAARMRPGKLTVDCSHSSSHTNIYCNIGRWPAWPISRSGDDAGAR